MMFGNPLLLMSDEILNRAQLNFFFQTPWLFQPYQINSKIRSMGTSEQNSIIVDEIYDNQPTQLNHQKSRTFPNSQQFFGNRSHQMEIYDSGIPKSNKVNEKKRNVNLNSDPHIRLSYIKFPQNQKNIDPIIITKQGLTNMTEEENNYTIIGRQISSEGLQTQADIQLCDQGASPLHCKLYTRDVFSRYFQIEPDFMTFLCICDRRSQSLWQNLPKLIIKNIYQFTKSIPSLLVKDLGSSTGTYTKVSRSDPNTLSQQQSFMIGADTTLLIIGINKYTTSSYEEDYFFNCLVKEIERGVELHGLSFDESERLTKFYNNCSKKRPRSYRLSCCGRAYLKTEFSTKGQIQKHLFFEKQQQEPSLFRIGRSQDSDVIIHLNTVSRRQSQIIYDPNKKEWYLLDGGENKESANGTWEALKLRKQPSFKDVYGGQILRISDTQLKVDFVNFDVQKKRKLNLEITNKHLKNIF